MYNYRAPLRDIRFVVQDLLHIEDHYRGFGREELNRELLEGILEEGAKFAETVLAPTNRVGDEHGLKFDNGKVVTRRASRRRTTATARTADHDDG